MKDCRYYDMCFRCGDECNGEPECPHRRTCQFYSPMPDREALLELADDLGNMSEELPPAFRDMGASIAHRIRDALGVTGDAQLG